MKTLWIVSGGVEAVPGIIRAKEMGLHVVVSDKNPEAPGFQYADNAIIASTYDAQETTDAAVKFHETIRPIDGVISIASDVPMTIASMADRLGLPGISEETAALASDKHLMKRFLNDRMIPVPWFSLINSFDELADIVNKRGFPLVIKPVDSRGARGVLRLNEGIDLMWAYNLAKNNSPSKKVIIEEFVDGPQISTEAVTIDGVGYTLGFSDRNYEFIDRFSPYFIENGGSQPSYLNVEDRKAVSELAIKTGKLLGVTDGIIKGDMVLSKEGPKVIEIAPRLSGGWFSTDQIPLHTGVDLIGAAIKIALGEKVDPDLITPKLERAVAIRYFFPPAGNILEVPNVDELERMPGVYKVLIFVKKGEKIEPVTDHTKRVGCVISCGDSRENAIKMARDVVKKAENGFIIN